MIDFLGIFFDKNIFPRLYNLTFRKHITVNKVIHFRWACMHFHRNMWGDLAIDCTEILTICDTTQLCDEPDKLIWLQHVQSRNPRAKKKKHARCCSQGSSLMKQAA